MKTTITITLTVLLSVFLMACVTSPQGVALEKDGVQNFCLDTVCNSMENSGPHYQRKQQGYLD